MDIEFYEVNAQLFTKLETHPYLDDPQFQKHLAPLLRCICESPESFYEKWLMVATWTPLRGQIERLMRRETINGSMTAEQIATLIFIDDVSGGRYIQPTKSKWMN